MKNLSGKYAIERLLETYETSAFNKPVRLVIANERAYNESKRYIDEDLQRAELVDSPANHEQKLAKEIARAFEEVELVLSLHSTESDSDDFIVIPELTVEGLQTVKSLGIDTRAVWKTGGFIEDITNVISLEINRDRSERANRQAYELLLDYFYCTGVLSGESSSSHIHLYEMTTSYGDGSERFLHTNFKEVEEGEVFAETPTGEPIKAQEAFYPVLMSDNGYEYQLGYKAKKIGKLSD